MAVHRDAQRDIPHAEALSAQIRSPLQFLVGYAHEFADCPREIPHALGIPLSGFNSDELLVEHHEGGVERRLVPLHPLIVMRAFPAILVTRRACAMDIEEIADDDVALPEHEAVVFENGNPSGRIEREKARVDASERSAHYAPLVTKSEFLQTP